MGWSGEGAREEFWALKDVSFEVRKGEAVGIIGRNGAGKSTLLKILSRITYPSTGRFEINGRVSSLLEVGTGFHPELTGRENIYLNGTILGMRRAEIRKKFDAIVDFSGVEKFLDTPVKHYSSGMKVRLAFSVAAHLEPEILIIDEVLAVGDAEFQKKCLGKMDEVSKGQGRTVLFVSHNMRAVESLCSTGMLLNHGSIELAGPIKEVIKAYIGKRKPDEIEVEHPVVKKVKVFQRNTSIIIKLTYKELPGSTFPFLGFLVTDESGTVLFGSNPSLARSNVFRKDISCSGSVEAAIESPMLVTGSYLISIFFGDGAKDIYVCRDCLTLDYVSKDYVYDMRSHVLGRIIPKVEFRYYEE
jgi:lipopolysaccharide transport system ATP-binding protein